MMTSVRRASFLAAGTAGVLAPAFPAIAQTVPPIRVGAVPVEAAALMFYAVERGFFKAAGINIELTPFPGAGPILLAAAGGALDVGCANTGAQANAHVRGVPFGMIAPCGLYESAAPTTVLAVLRGSPVENARQLSGKTVACLTIRDLQQASVMKWADTTGGDSSTLKFIELPASEMVSAMKAGRVDAVTLTEPQLAQSKNDVRILAKNYDAIHDTLLINSHFGPSAWLDKNASLARAFIATLREAAIWSNKNRAATGSIIERLAKLAPGTASRMNRTVYGEVLDPTIIQPSIDVTAEYKFLPKTFAATDMFWTGLR
jgi:NitT/TauT family transport system substrate-binding protein